jgi:ribose transport system ATP-binding protein
MADPNEPDVATPRLALTGISKVFPGVVALQDVSFDVRAGEVHALIGENGAGKSTLLKILSGVFRASHGEIRIDGSLCDIAHPRAARELGIALIHQELQQVPELDVAQNMFLGRQHKQFGVFTDKNRMRQEARAVLEHLDPSIEVTTPIRNLRVAQRQIVEIAKALLADARIIAMDEPTSSLSPHEFEKLTAVIETLSARGVAVIYVSHKLDEVFRVASRATVLRDGRVVGSADIKTTSEADLVGLMVGRTLDVVHRQSHARSEIVLSVADLGRGRAVRGVGFDLRAGEILGVSGLVGAGRTELVRLIAGLDRPTSGTIKVKGRPLAFHTPRDAIAAGIALLPEDRKKEGIIPFRSIMSNVALPRLNRTTRFGLLNLAAIRTMVGDLTRSVALRPAAVDRAIRLFSGGNQQKAIICRWLMAKVDILIFDEPTRGIDVGAKSEIYQLIENLAAEGRAVIVVSSDLPEILRLADRVLVIRRGEVAGLLDRAGLDEESVMRIAV